MTEDMKKDINKEEGIRDGEHCGVEEFEGKKFDTCKGEEITVKGYRNPDKE
ncbi:MAG: hypothetical protein Q4D88_01595 [Anaerococcus sp.]|nr:hypothetical protein [Anaerococcus sp.]